MLGPFSVQLLTNVINDKSHQIVNVCKINYTEVILTQMLYFKSIVNS